MLLCPKCGASLEGDSRFCSECGLPLDIAPEMEDDGHTRLVDEDIDFGEESYRDMLDGESFGRSSAHNTPAILFDGQVGVAPEAVMGRSDSFSGDSAQGYSRLQAPSPQDGQLRSRNGKTGVIVALVAVVAVLATLVAVFAVNSCNSSNTVEETRQLVASSAQGDSGQTGNEMASSSAATADSPYIYKTEDVRIEMPARYADEGCEWNQDESTVTFAQDGNTAVEIVWGSAANKQSEAKFDSYIIGEVSHGSIGLTAFLRVFRWDDQRRAVYAGNAAEGTSSLDVLGISLNDVVSWISLYTVRGFVPAAIQSDAKVDGGSSADESSNQESSTAAFWGVWIGASKSQNEAESLASVAQGTGLPAEVVQTTEWENLNTEPWYVVTVGRSSSQVAAESLLSAAESAGYTDAYVKYSGEHRG